MRTIALILLIITLIVIPAYADDYLDGWEWTEPIDVEGSAGEATERISLHYNASFPTDLVSRLKNLHMEGKRDPTPGSIDDWFEQS